MINKYSPKQLDNFHILTWLIKDVVWAKEYVVLATIMIVPTIGIALVLTLQSLKFKSGLYSNFAVLCWMVADSVWMLDEFNQLDILWIPVVIFCLGIGSMCYYYITVCDIFKLKSEADKSI